MTPSPPNSTAAARASRSSQWPSAARMTTRLPRSSVITHGDGSIPAISIVTCCTSGKARPMPSASTTGSPIRAAHATGRTPFPPPISAAITAATVPPGHLLEPLAQPLALALAAELLDRDGGRADPAARHDQTVVGQVVEVDHLDRSVLVERVQAGQLTGVGVAAAARAEHGAAAGQPGEVRGVDAHCGILTHPIG